MDLLHRIGRRLAAIPRQAALKAALGRLNPRALADLGLGPADIPAVACLGARLGPEGASLGDVVARARAERTGTPTASDRLFAALERTSARRASTPGYRAQEVDRYLAAAHRLRDETMAAFWRSLGAGLKELARPVTRAALDSGLGQWIRLQLVWRRAYRQTRAELASYSDRELMTDLRLTRSEIDDIAAEGADERLSAHIAADPALRRAGLGLRALHRAHG